MTVGWHDMPKAHQSYTDIFFFAYIRTKVEPFYARELGSSLASLKRRSTVLEMNH